LALAALAALALSAAGCGGPLPPADPFYLGSAKDSLSRGNHWYLRGCFREAARFYDEALASARLSDSVVHMVMSLNALGAVRLAEGNLGAAAALLDEAAELSRSDPAMPELPAVLGNLGTLAWRAGRRSDALGFWEDAASRAQAAGLSPAVHLASLARARLGEGAPAEAAFADALERARASLEHPGTPPAARADVLNLLARDAYRRGLLEESRSFLSQALEIDRHEENQAGLAEDLELSAKLQGAAEDFPAAASSLERAFYLRAALKDREGTRRVLSALRELRLSAGLPKSLERIEAVARDPELFSPMDDRCP
jgi:tetratricopeptide (TPR) repeat protein